ncbi:MAG: VPLPA-CTERM sorting domain-containing protein [Pikeienuella sp.]
MKSAPNFEFVRSDGAVAYRFQNGALLPSDIPIPPVGALRETDTEATIASGRLTLALPDETPMQPVPQPAAVWLLAAGLGALAAIGRRG